MHDGPIHDGDVARGVTSTTDCAVLVVGQTVLGVDTGTDIWVGEIAP